MTPPGGSERIGRLAPRDRIQVGILLGLALALLPPAPGPAQSLQVQPPFDSAYSVTDLGPPPGVPPRLGGLTPRVGTPDRLLIGGQANDSGGGLYEIGSVRDVAGHLIGFSGPAVRFADAANNDGGVTYGPGGVLFLARWPNNELAQAKPGSTSTEDHPACAARRNGIAGSDPVHTTGPARRRVVQARGLSDGRWYDADVVPDDTRTYDVVTCAPCRGRSCPAARRGSFTSRPARRSSASPACWCPSTGAGSVAAYQVDADGDLIIASRRTFIDGLSERKTVSCARASSTSLDDGSS